MSPCGSELAVGWVCICSMSLSSFFLRETLHKKNGRRARTKHHLRSLLMSSLLTSHWLKRITWPSPTSKGQGGGRHPRRDGEMKKTQCRVGLDLCDSFQRWEPVICKGIHTLLLPTPLLTWVWLSRGRVAWWAAQKAWLASQA